LSGRRGEFWRRSQQGRAKKEGRYYVVNEGGRKIKTSG